MKARNLIVVLGIVLGLGLGFYAVAQVYEGDGDIYGSPGMEMMPPMPQMSSSDMPGKGGGKGPMMSDKDKGSCPMGMGMGMGLGMGMGPGMGGCMGMSMGPGMGMGMGCDHMMKMRYLDQIKKQDPARYDRIMKIHDLAKDYRDETDPAKKKQIEDQLRPLLDADLKIQQEDARKHLDLMQKHIDKERKLLKEREDHWKEVVDFQVKKVTGQEEYLNYPMKPW